MTPVHSIVIDWDGTAVQNTWPKRPTQLMPGFIEAAHKLRSYGYNLVVHSARYTPFDPWTGEPQDNTAEIGYIRQVLDAHHLHFIGIWRPEHGKAPGSVYVDDKGIHYGGGPRDWERVAEKIIGRLAGVAPTFPAIRP